MFVVVTDDGTGQVGYGGPGYWKHIDGQAQYGALVRLFGEPRPVTRADHDQLRAGCLHGERCPNDATG